MKLHAKLLIVLIPVFIGAFVVHSFVMYQEAQTQAYNNLLKNASDIRAILMATRRVYHHQFMDSGLPVTDDTVGFLPAHALSRIAKDFQEWNNSGVRFNNVSDRARNSENTADEIELVAMNYFRQNPDEEERFVPFTSEDGEPMYHYTRPIWIEEYCLKCHGNREDAPPSIGTRYATSYGYKLGDLRGVMSIKLPSKVADERAMAMVRKNLTITLIGYLFSFTLIYTLLVRQTTKRLSILELGGRAMARGHYDWSSGMTGRDEISQVAAAFEEMGSRVKNREANLLEQTEHIQLLLDSTVEAIYGVDLEGICTFCNHSCLQLLGYESSADLLGKNMHELIHHSHADGTAYPLENCHIFKSVNSQKTHVDDEVFWRADGSSMEVEYHASPIVHEGEVQGVIVTFMDITERKGQANALAASESRLRAILEASLDPIVTINSYGIIQKASASFEGVFGWKSKDVVGQNISVIMPEPYRSQHDGYLERYRKTHTSKLLGKPRELEAQRKDGTIFPCEVSINRVDLPGQTDPLFAGTIRDITERKKFEESRRLMMNELDHRVKNTLASVLSLFKQSVTQTKSDEELIETFPRRIQSLAQTHEALAANKWEGVGLRKIIQMGLPELKCEAEPRIRLDGADIQLPPVVTSPMCMALHELTTNARKYGALSNNFGEIDIQWAVDPKGNLRVVWRESQGPPIETPPVEGYGTSLIRGFIEHELAGEVFITYHTDGIECILEFSLTMFENE